MTRPLESEPLMTRDETAKYLGVTRAFLEANKKQGPPYYRLTPATVRYDRKKVDQWLSQREVK